MPKPLSPTQIHLTLICANIDELVQTASTAQELPEEKLADLRQAWQLCFAVLDYLEQKEGEER